MMDLERIAPELRALTTKSRPLDVSRPITRVAGRVMGRLARPPRVPGVQVSERRAERARVRLYLPERRARRAALVWVHGGGLIMGNPRQDELICGQTASELGIAVVSAYYRLAPEHPFPEPLDDVRAVWQWTADHAAEIDVDPRRIAIGGESAGGGLAAALAQRLHDEGGVQPAAQWLFAPMLDDRTATDTSLDGAGYWVWDNASNRIGWRSYLSQAPGAPDLPAYASPARREDFSGLPPAYLNVGDAELFHDEVTRYAARLHDAGVPTALDVVPGAPHGVAHADGTIIARDLLQRARDWLAQTLDQTSVRGTEDL